MSRGGRKNVLNIPVLFSSIPSQPHLETFPYGLHTKPSLLNAVLVYLQRMGLADPGPGSALDLDPGYFF